MVRNVFEEHLAAFVGEWAIVVVFVIAERDDPPNISDTIDHSSDQVMDPPPCLPVRARMG